MSDENGLGHDELEFTRRLSESRAALDAAHLAIQEAEDRRASYEEVARLVALCDDAYDVDYRLYREDLARRADATHNIELRVAYQANGNMLALLTALRVTYSLEAHPMDAPFQSGEGIYFVPEWVVNACYDIVAKRLTAPEPGAKGRHARWLTRFQDEIKDHRRWVVVQWCLDQGVSVEESRGAAGEFFDEPEKTIEHAVARVEARRRAAKEHVVALGVEPTEVPEAGTPFRPTYHPEFSDPLAGRVSGGVADDLGYFGALSRYLAEHRGEILEEKASPEIVKMMRLAETLDRIKGLALKRRRSAP